MNILKAITLLGWWFIVCNNFGDPSWKLGEYTTLAACNMQREEYKQLMPDRKTLGCFQEYILQQ